MNFKSFILFLCITAFSLSHLLAQSTENFTYVRSGIKYKYLGTYDIKKLNSILTTDAAAFSEYKITYAAPKHPVKLYRVIYNSVIPELNNKPTEASGLIAIPDNGKDKMPIISYQHGTVFGKTDVPYFPEESVETRLMIANFATHGYIFIAADNFGKGISSEADAYQAKASTQQADLDMLMASKEILKTLKIQEGPLFLSGWSMGSWSTLVFMQKLQSLNIPVKAVSLACTPTDVYALFNNWMHAPDGSDAGWLPGILAIQLHAYEHYYDLPGLTHSAIKAEYIQACKDYYQNKITFNEFYSKTPHKVSELLKPEFIAASSLGQGRYWQILQENSSHRFRSNTIINCYYGEVDEALPVYISTLLGDYQKLMGGSKVSVISAGKQGDHRGTFKFSMKDSKVWFDSFLK